MELGSVDYRDVAKKKCCRDVAEKKCCRLENNVVS